MKSTPVFVSFCVVLLHLGGIVLAESPPVRVLVWDERQPAQKEAYDGGFLGEAIAAHLAKQTGFAVRTASLESPDQGVMAAELDATDVVVWWGHVRNRELEEKRAEGVVDRVKAGRLALVALHSAHWSLPFVRLMEARALADAKAHLSEVEFAALETVRPKPFVAPKREDALTPALVRKAGGAAGLTLPGCCFPAYRADGKPSHIKTLLPEHPIAKGLPAAWDIPRTEMYDEPFHVPPPDAVIFEERWDPVSLVRPEGEHFRSGSLWRVGKGQVFYFRPGHETYPIYRQAENLRVVENAARWLGAEVSKAAASSPKPAARAPSKLVLPGETFVVAERPAFVFLPPEGKRTLPQPWIFYAPTLPGYPDAAERWMHESFLAAGIAVAGVDVGEAYGSPKSHAAFEALYRELIGKRGFAPKPCLLGRSRGGLWASSWAIAHPERVAGLAGIYPVFDLRSYPKLDAAAPAYGLTREQLEARLGEFNPVERLGVLAKAKIPAILIQGDIDVVVPLEQNSAELVRRYVEAGAGDLVKLIVLKGQGHNFFEGFFHSQEVVDFAIARARAGARSGP